MGRTPSSGSEIPDALKALLARHGDVPASVIADARAAFAERVDHDDLAACTDDRIVCDPPDAGPASPVRVLTFTHARVTVNAAVVPLGGGVLLRGTIEPGDPVGIDVVTPDGALDVSRDGMTFTAYGVEHGVVRVIVHLGHPPARVHAEWFAV